MITSEKLDWLDRSVQEIIDKAKSWEQIHADKIEAVVPEYRLGAINLIHYLAFRSLAVDALQDELRNYGLPSLSNIEGHVMSSLLVLKSILNNFRGKPSLLDMEDNLTLFNSSELLHAHTDMLFGKKSKKRSTRIMVTMPSTVPEDEHLVGNLLQNGMNSARINCAHDSPEIWKQMVLKIRGCSKKHHTDCKIMMDLAGPKLRTGPMIPGPQVIYFKPKRDDLGQLVKPAKLWIAAPGTMPAIKKYDAILPVPQELIDQMHRGDELTFTDTRGKQRLITIDRKKGKGYVGYCNESAYITAGTEILLTTIEETGVESNYIGELLPIEIFLLLDIGDTLILHADPKPGEPAVYDENKRLLRPAHISCTLPEVLQYLKVGEPVFMNDGKIEGVIVKASAEEVEIKITYAKKGGAKLRADKGLNFPLSNLVISGLTDKDRYDLYYAVMLADAINLSFVNDAGDVQDYLDAVAKFDKRPGLIVKIETDRGFKNLPEILLRAMQTYPVGVMIARGDLAIETGWKNFASIQDEIMRISEAATVPVVWATQVLENLAKKGIPTRSEITDAALAARTECVMLNKGPYIEKTVKTLDKILRRMQKFQHKKKVVLPCLKTEGDFQISHHAYDV